MSPYPPSGPGRSHAGPPWYGYPLTAASGPIRARFTSYSSKVSRNGRVSPENVQKACHSPCFQNGLGMSALDILRFPFSAAFSHKELMAYFEATMDFLVRMTKCRLNVHAEGSTDTPTVHASQLASVDRSSSVSAREILTVFSTNPLLTVLQEIMTETGF